MKKLISDRRLWLTVEGDQVVEDGDPRARFLLVACAGRAVPAHIAARLELEVVDGRLVYPEGPELEGDGGAEETEDGEDPIVHKFGNDASGGRDKIDPQGGDGADTSRRAPPKGDDVESAVRKDDLAERRAAAEALQAEKAEARAAAEAEADDSDRNDEAPAEWTLRSSPEAYLNRYPKGPNADLARAVIAARDDGADGGS